MRSCCWWCWRRCFAAGYVPWATLTLQMASVTLFLMAIWQRHPVRLRVTEIGFLALLFVIPALYLTPLPGWLTVVSLPGRTLYQEALALLDTTQTGLQRLSVAPPLTEASWWMLVVPIGVYVAVRTLSEAARVRVIYAFFAIVLAQVLIALFQFAANMGADYAVADLLNRSGSSGTYVNRNHLAGMIELALPLALALFVYNFGSRFKGQRRTAGLRERALAVLKSGNRPSLIFICW
jgi:hypothetical protein